MPKANKPLFDKPRPIYAPGVRIGNWVADEMECPKDGNFYYPPKDDIDFEAMKPESRQADFRQNKLNGQQGTGLFRVIRHDSHNRCGNYTTTNDLVYNHLPKPLCGPDMRYYARAAHTYHPQPDLLKCYGHNLTEWGLRAYKHHEWKCTDVSDYTSSLYEDTFVPPHLNQYLKAAERKARDSSFTKTFRFLMTKPITRPKKK